MKMTSTVLYAGLCPPVRGPPQNTLLPFNLNIPPFDYAGAPHGAPV